MYGGCLGFEDLNGSRRSSLIYSDEYDVISFISILGVIAEGCLSMYT